MYPGRFGVRRPKWSPLDFKKMESSSPSGVTVPQCCMFGLSPWSPFCHSLFLTHLHLSPDEPPAHLQSRFWEQQEFPFLFVQALGCLGTAGKENS